MPNNLIIVESPAKARTINKFLGNDYIVVASMGHVRDLPQKELGFDPSNHFEPRYEITKDKKKTISDIKKRISKETVVYLATDEDREGESISWHLIEALKLQKHPDIKRIVFHEITKPAILKALQNPRDVDTSLVDAQQARRILDRAVGYELSPLLWKKVKPGLSAGRVQSVAVRILVDREREIREFKPLEFWRIRTAYKKYDFQAEVVSYKSKKTEKSIPNEATALEIVSSLEQGKICKIADIEERETTRKPVAPFTTSTIQQEASLKLGFSPRRTMSVAQQLYEGNFEIPGYSGGLITYMRTDSTTLSEESLQQAKQVILSEYGKEYALIKPRRFATQAKGAQEAHEAIRPVDLSMKPQDVRAHLSPEMAKLYDLVWKRMIACQMTEAIIARTTLKLEGGNQQECLLEVKGQRLVFPGFLKAYTEGSENPDADLEKKDVILPKVEKGQSLEINEVIPEQHFTKPPPRYTEAGLIKKLEAEGVGRPSTYAPTISTIQDRQYAERGEDKRLRPTDLGEVVTDYLVNHFTDIVNLNFTARIEEDLDEIANGKRDWVSMMTEFYQPFHDNIAAKQELPPDKGEKILGTDPQTGRQVSVRVGRYGPMVQIGTKDDEDKPKFASLPKDRSMHEIQLEEALKLFSLPRHLGNFDASGEEIIVNRGRFGPYVKLGNHFFSIPKEIDPLQIDREEAIELIRQGKESKAKQVLHDFGEIQVLKGPYGPYIKYNKKNFKIPKNTDAESLDKATCEQIISEAPPPRPKRKTKAS